MARSTFASITLFLFAASCGLDTRARKEIPARLIDSSWQAQGNGVYLKENMECSDTNGDGRFDYFRLQDPPGSYQHWVWLDTDYDGFFDTFNGQSGDEGNIRIAVPRKIESEN